MSASDVENVLNQVAMSQQILNVLDKVEPGLTRRRGQVLRSLVLLRLKLLKLEPVKGFEMMKQMKQLMIMTREITKCQQFESEEEREEWSNTIRKAIISSSQNASE